MSLLDRRVVMRLCTERGWEVGDLAKHSQVPIASLYKYLHRRKPVRPPRQRVCALANAFELDQVTDLLAQEDA
ncbi:helix-turn-helix domain-containing protein [Nocardiopsis synnemataformans]|uniref:helix-turn-helix domain-containing protein n=1 Tax=Nocardiopsis synnemataformans TaxID=61305 RepID=UPI003EBADB43